MLAAPVRQQLRQVEERRAVQEQLAQSAPQAEHVRGGEIVRERLLKNAVSHVGAGSVPRGIRRRVWRAGGSRRARRARRARLRAPAVSRAALRAVPEPLGCDVAPAAPAGVEEEGVVRGVVRGQRLGLEGGEVGEERPAPRRDQHVFEFHVAVRDAALVAVRQAVQQLVRHPLLLDVAQERARADSVVQRAVRVLAHQVHRAVRLELALERPRVQMRGRGGGQRVSQSPQSTLVLLDQRGVEAAAGARRAALQVHLHHDQPAPLALLVAGQERLQEPTAPEAVLEDEIRDIRGEEFAGLHPRGRSQLVPHLGAEGSRRVSARPPSPRARQSLCRLRTPATFARSPRWRRQQSRARWETLARFSRSP